MFLTLLVCWAYKKVYWYTVVMPNFTLYVLDIYNLLKSLKLLDVNKVYLFCS